jgi:hypothetical protein
VGGIIISIYECARKMTMIILITGASHTGKTAPAQKHNLNYILINDKYEINAENEYE